MTGGGLSDRTVLIIGGTSGIGLEVARQSAALGARLILAGRDPAKLARVADELGAEPVVMDAHDATVVEEVFAALPVVDDVVSMVGDSMAGGFLSAEAEVMRHVLHSKFWSNRTIARNVAGKIRGGGSLTFTAGTGARPHEGSATCVANRAIAAMVEGLAVEMAPAVRVNAIAPTFMGTATALWRELPPDEVARMQETFPSSIPLGRLGTLSEVASSYVHLMGNGFVTGQVLAVDGGVMLTQ